MSGFIWFLLNKGIVKWNMFEGGLRCLEHKKGTAKPEKNSFPQKPFREISRPERDSAQAYRLIKKINNVDYFPYKG